MKVEATEAVPLVKPTSRALEIDHRALTNRVRTSLTYVGSDTGSPEPVRRPSPATDHTAEILDLDDPYVDYNAEQFSSQQAR